MVEAAGIVYRYPQAPRPALNGFNLHLSHGEIVALTGRNGSGKTTVARILTGVLRQDSGEVRIDGEATGSMNLFDIGRRIGYVFQDPSRQLFCDTVENEIAFGLKNMGLPGDEIRERISRYLCGFRIDNLRAAFPGTLSRGEKQRVVLACVMSMGPRYLVLDEPTNGLDMHMRDSLARMLTELRRDDGCGILLISHERAFIESVADREEALEPL